MAPDPVLLLVNTTGLFVPHTSEGAAADATTADGQGSTIIWKSRFVSLKKTPFRYSLTLIPITK